VEPAVIRSLVALSLLVSVAAPAAALEPTPAPDTPGEAPLSLDAELHALFRVAACDGEGAPDPRFDEKTIDAHCRALAKTLERYRQTWLTPARPFFDTLVPGDAPKTIVYPFAGGDLMTALAVFPDLDEITTISLEAGGDARGIFRESSQDLARHLALHRRFLDELVRWNHNRTLDLAALKRTPLPSQLIFALVGLSVHGYEPVALRAIALGADGAVRALTPSDFARFDAEVAGFRGAKKNARLNDLFANYELVFRKKGDTRERVYRHFQANLHNDRLANDPRILRHLDRKGRVTAMTKAASHLLWHKGFSAMRDWLKSNVAWMVSDSTGINPLHLEPEHWEQTVYGSFDTAVFNPTAEGQVAMRALFASQPHRPLPMKLFGYPTKRVRGLLIVTQPRAQDP
jgi:hypothetical protein